MAHVRTVTVNTNLRIIYFNLRTISMQVFTRDSQRVLLKFISEQLRHRHQLFTSRSHLWPRNLYPYLHQTHTRNVQRKHACTDRAPRQTFITVRYVCRYTGDRSRLRAQHYECANQTVQTLAGNRYGLHSRLPARVWRHYWTPTAVSSYQVCGMWRMM